jgi:hypothetical protein
MRALRAKPGAAGAAESMTLWAMMGSTVEALEGVFVELLRA